MESNFDLVEGEWKGLIFKRILPEDYPRVLDHVSKYFLREEPTCKLLGWTTEFGAEMSRVIREMLKHNLSFYALDPTNNEVAGVRVTFDSKYLNFEKLEIHERRSDILLNAIDLTGAQKDEILTRWNVESYAEFFVASTHPDYRNRGLAMEMYQRSLKFLKAQGFQLVECIFTSSSTRRTASKLGFEEIARIYYKDVVDENGEPIFRKDEIKPDHYAASMVKSLL